MSTVTIPPLRFDQVVPRPRGGRLRGLLVGTAVGLAGGLVGYQGFAVLERTLAGGEMGDVDAAVLFALLPALLLAITIHEVGHLTAGRLVGLRFVLFLLGPLKVFRHGERVRWALNTNLVLGGGGAVSAPEPGRMHDLRRRYWWMIAGGPLASFLFGAAALAAAAALDGAPTLRALAMICGGFSILAGVVTLIPHRGGGIPSDGARLLLLSARRGAAAEQEAAFMGLGTAALLGHRPRDWDPALVARISVPGEGATGALAAVLAYSHAMDSARERDAADHLQRALDGLATLPPAQRPLFTLEAAYFEAIVREDAAAARRWLEALRPTALIPLQARLRAEAAVLAAEGRAEEALASASRARSALGGSYEAGGAAHFDEDLQAIERRARTATGDPTLTHSLSR